MQVLKVFPVIVFSVAANLASANEDHREVFAKQLEECWRATNTNAIVADSEISLSVAVLSNGDLKGPVRRSSGGWLSAERANLLGVAIRVVSDCAPFQSHSSEIRSVVSVRKTGITIDELVVLDAENPTEEIFREIAGTDDFAMPKSQGAATDSTESEDKDEDLGTGTTDMVKRALNRCYEGKDDAPKDLTARVVFTLTGNGSLFGNVIRAAGEQVGSAGDTLAIAAKNALESCTPFPGSGIMTTYTAEIDRGKVRFLQATGIGPPPETQNPAAIIEPPKVAATAEIETALKLNKTKRREIQNRLRLAGLNPGGADGAIGKKTRAAISTWQVASGFPQSGFLDGDQVAALSLETEEAYKEYLRTKPKHRRRKQKVCSSSFLGFRVCQYK